MPVGLLIGSVLALFLAYGPAMLIGCSSNVSGWDKVKWVILGLSPPIALGGIGLLMVLLLVDRHPTLVASLTPVLNIAGYSGAWYVFWLFKKRRRQLARLNP